jgi:hypothetical protein
MKNSDFVPVPNVGINASDAFHLGYIDHIDHDTRYHNQHCYKGAIGEVFNLPSMTVPDMHTSLRELIDRHLRGGNVKVFQGTNVSPDSMIPVGLERMSSIDRAELAQRTSDFIVTTRGRMVTARQAADKAAFDALIEAKAAERFAANAAAASSDL